MWSISKSKSTGSGRMYTKAALCWTAIYTIWLALMICLIAMAGCSNSPRIVRTPCEPIDEVLHNHLLIATHNPIPVMIEGTDSLFDLDVGGYYIIHAADLRSILRRLAEYRTAEKARSYGDRQPEDRKDSATAN